MPGVSDDERARPIGPSRENFHFAGGRLSEIYDVLPEVEALFSLEVIRNVKNLQYHLKKHCFYFQHLSEIYNVLPKVEALFSLEVILARM